MAHPPSSYDERLLKDAPVATKEQIQEGYNPDLLVPSPRSKSVVHRSQTPSGAAPPVPIPLRTDSDIEQGQSVSHNGSQHGYERKVMAGTAPPSGKVPFWRKTKGIIVIAVLALVIIAAIIGGAVGGTRHKPKPKSIGANSSSGDQGATGSGSGKGGGGSSSSSSPPATIGVGSGGGSSSSSPSTFPSGIPDAISGAIPHSTASANTGQVTPGAGPNQRQGYSVNQQQTGPDPVLQVPAQERDLGPPL